MTRHKWWKEAIIYQIYPRSFKDSDGDGIGDIAGIMEKVDYLSDLGVDIVWLGPVYPSPNDDNGYDISDYRGVHPDFGSMKDLDKLIALLHDRGIRIIMDLVVNHTSDEHDWFTESRKSTNNSFREYYIWKKGKDGGPPNNWMSFFGGSAWEYDETSDEYYLHLFTKKQPDLNWENPKVRQGVGDIIKYWLDKGIDGFRMDVIPLISKRLDFNDTDLDTFPEIVENVYSNGPRVHEFISEIVEKVISHYDVMTVGEGPGIHAGVGLDYVGEDRGELNMIFHLEHMFLGFGTKGKFDPVPYSLNDVFQIFNKWDNAMGKTGWISIFLDNHDFARMVSRFGNDQGYRVESAKLLGTLILTLRGTPSIFQGSEIGMTNVSYDSLEEFDDVEARNFIDEALEEGRNKDEILALVNRLGRDNARTPMQWNDSMNAGFTSGIPWLKINPNYPSINVESSLSDKDSVYTYYKRLISFRKDHKVFVYGEYQCVLAEAPLFIYKRTDPEETYLIVLNFSDKKTPVPIETTSLQLVISNYIVDENLEWLRPWESRMYLESNTA